MHIFVTGATGFIGSAVVAELIANGHQVTGLARSDAAAEALAAAGARSCRGELTDDASLRHGLEGVDGVIHTAFIHDFSRFRENCEIDRHAIGVMRDALGASRRPLVVTSGTGLLALQPATEDAMPPADSPVPRVATEQAADDASARGTHISIVRLPPSVHGAGDHGFVPMLIALAREKGVSAYVGHGENRWPAVHRLDAARLFRLAVEHDATPGTRWHGVAEGGVAFRDIATAIGNGLGLPVVSVAPGEAAQHFGWFAHFAMMDNLASSEHTRNMLGWQPGEAGLLADMANPASAYFRT